MKYLHTLLLALSIAAAPAALAQDPVGEKEVAKVLQTQPEYPGGQKAFMQYVGKSFRTPDLDFETDFTARIVATFIVEKDGSVTNVKILKDPGYGLGAEAKRVLEACPKKWNPGIQDGKPVRASYTVPISVHFDATIPPAPVEQPKKE
jgi:hypothetical protein